MGFTVLRMDLECYACFAESAGPDNASYSFTTPASLVIALLHSVTLRSASPALLGMAVLVKRFTAIRYACSDTPN